MKKIVIIAVLALAAAFTANAQPKAVGLRFGWYLEASYEHTVGQKANFVEANIGLFGYSSVLGTATYNFMIAQPQWTSRGEWGFYAGPGLSAGFTFWGFWGGSGMVSAVANIGLEYTFWFPLQLSVDIRPQFGAVFGRDFAGYNLGGLYGFIPSLSVRYAF